MIRIDQELCVGCGLCVKDCVRTCLAIKEPEHKVEMIHENCLLCGHCEAICPREAISLELDGYEGMKDFCLENAYIDPDELAMFMANRRSARNFQNRPVEQEKIDKIIEAGRFSPTGSNKQGIEYILMRGDRLKEISKKASLSLTGENMEKVAKKLNPAVLERLYNAALKGEDRLFFGAPLVIAMTDATPDGIDIGLAATRMELMANAMGLGVCFNAIYPYIVNAVPEVQEICGASEGHYLKLSMMIGYPTVSYHRPAKRKKAVVKEL